MITMYATAVCPYCTMAAQLLAKKGVATTAITKIYIDANPEERAIMMEKTNRRTVPQIFIGEHHVGGFDDLKKLDDEGGLTPLLIKENLLV